MIELSEALTPKSFESLLNKTFPPNMFWLEPNILPKGGIMLFGGNAKIGKSFIALELMKALTGATQPFDCHTLHVPQKVKALLIEQEVGEYGLKKRIQSIFTPTVLNDCTGNVHYLSMVPELKLDELKGRKLLRLILDKIQPNILILDPISKLHNYEEQSNSQIGELLGEISAIRKEYSPLNLSVIMSHHFGKPQKLESSREQCDPLTPYNFRGASRWFDDVDAAVTVHKAKLLDTVHYATELHVRWTLRHGEELEDMVFTFNRLNDCRVRYEGLVKDLASQPKKFKVPPLSFKPTQRTGTI